MKNYLSEQEIAKHSKFCSIGKEFIIKTKRGKEKVILGNCNCGLLNEEEKQEVEEQIKEYEKKFFIF